MRAILSVEAGNWRRLYERERCVAEWRGENEVDYCDYC